MRSVLCCAWLGMSPRSGYSAGMPQEQPRVLEKCLRGGLWPAAFHPVTFPSHRVPSSSVPPLYHEVRANTSFRIPSGCKWLEPIVNRKTQIQTVTSKTPNSKEGFSQTSSLDGWGGLVVPGTDDRPVALSQASDCLGAALTPQAPSLPVPPGPGCRVVRMGAHSTSAAARPRAGTPGLAPQPIRACTAGDLPWAWNKLSSFPSAGFTLPD